MYWTILKSIAPVLFWKEKLQPNYHSHTDQYGQPNSLANMDYWIRFLAQMFLSMFGLFLFDRALRWLDKDDDPNRRWFSAHAFANLFTTITSYPDMVHCVLNPLQIIGERADSLPMAISIAIHLHHITLYWWKMDVIDWLHHMISCMFVGFTALYFVEGPIINYNVFFICGLPGGIDYLLLAMKKYGTIHTLTEKWINVYLNMWIRLPGILYCCAVSYINYRIDPHEFNPLVTYLLVFLNGFNAIYFATVVVQNYGEWMAASTLKKTATSGLLNSSAKDNMVRSRSMEDMRRPSHLDKLN